MAHFESCQVLGHIHHKHPMDGMKCERATRSMSYSRLPPSYFLWLKRLMATYQYSCRAVTKKYASHWFNLAELERGGFSRLSAR